MHCLQSVTNMITSILGYYNCTMYGEVRLSGGQSQYDGRVEICLNTGWSRVCTNNWGSEESEVVCRQLGHPTPGA